MKTVLLFAALLWASASTKTFANDVRVNPVVLQTFESTFGNAANVKWSIVDRLYKAEFQVDGEETAAFFSIEDGTLVACSHYITLAELPRTLRAGLKEAAASAAIIELFEVQSDAGTDYYATIQKAGETRVLKAGSVKWTVFKKQ